MDRVTYNFVVLFLTFFNVFILTQGEENVALGGDTNQSSTYKPSFDPNGLSSLAVDGNTDSNYSRGSCSHTYNTGINWWCVDLHRDIDFQNINIYNRYSFSKDRLQGFEIRLGSTSECNEDGYQQSTVCYKDISNTTQDIYNINSCNQQQVQFNSRYVYISLDNTGDNDKYLALCEVEIFEKCYKNCKDGCDSNGICNNCVSGYYGDKCDTSCPINCNGGCQQSNGNCIGGCKKGFWGLKCNDNCNKCNQGCQQNNGDCNSGGCISGYYGDKCDTQCPTNCNGGCQQSNGNCIDGCKNGFWCLKCNDNCNNCIKGCQQDNGYCNSGGCVSGYYGDKCDKLCPYCNGSCQQSNGDCEVCSDGYWGSKCQSECPTNCKLSKCNKTNGYCIECKNYYWGDKCEEQCPANCKDHNYTTCYQTSGKCYSGCKETWYGDTCQSKSNCNCINECNQAIGICTSCKTGWYDNQTTGLCMSCIDGYKGSYCQDTCLDNCISCNRYTTQCTSCKTGWYGNQCQIKCNSNCINGCHQATGGCFDGCINGKTGRQCTEALESSDGISSVVAGIIGAVTSMVLLLIGNVLLVYCCLTKRNELFKLNTKTVRYTTSDDVETTIPTYENVQDDVTRSEVEAGPYESLDSPLPSPTYETLK